MERIIAISIEELFEKVNFLGLMDLDAKRFKVDKDPRYLEIRKAIENYFKEIEEAAKKEEALKAYEDRKAWAEKMVVNISKAGYFSSDRTIAEYNNDIWHVQ